MRMKCIFQENLHKDDIWKNQEYVNHKVGEREYFKKRVIRSKSLLLLNVKQKFLE